MVSSKKNLLRFCLSSGTLVHTTLGLPRNMVIKRKTRNLISMNNFTFPLDEKLIFSCFFNLSVSFQEAENFRNKARDCWLRRPCKIYSYNIRYLEFRKSIDVAKLSNNTKLPYLSTLTIDRGFSTFNLC